MRGKGSILDSFHVPWRITPAYAGKSLFLSIKIFVLQDHPRLCGEK